MADRAWVLRECYYDQRLDSHATLLFYSSMEIYSKSGSTTPVCAVSNP